MTRHVFSARTLAVAAVILLAGAALAALPSIAAHAATNSFRGVNWADVNDNFADSTVVPSGLSTSDRRLAQRRGTQRARSTRVS